MPRFVCLSKWKPEKWPEVAKRFAEYLKGTNTQVLEADQRLKTITWEFPSAYGQNRSVWIVEGELADISIILRYWMDLLEFKVMPSVDFDTIKKFYPDKHPNYE